MSRFKDLINRIPAWRKIYDGKQAEFVIRLNHVLDKRGLRPADLAREMKVSRPYASRLLSGKENLTLSTIAKIEAAIGEEILVVPSTKLPSEFFVVVNYGVHHDVSPILGRGPSTSCFRTRKVGVIDNAEPITPPSGWRQSHGKSDKIRAYC